MRLLLVFFVVFCFIGCTNNAQQPVVNPVPNNFPMINPDDPTSIEKWESSEHNYDNSKIVVVQLRLFQRTLGNSTPKAPKSVALEVSGARKTGPSSAQQATINSLVENETQIHSRVRKAVYDYYQESYPAYKEGWTLGAIMFGGDGDYSDILPEIKTGNELDSLIWISSIHIHPSSGDSQAMGIVYEVPWDEEHGIGILLLKGQVAKIGIAHDAFPLPQPGTE